MNAASQEEVFVLHVVLSSELDVISPEGRCLSLRLHQTDPVDEEELVRSILNHEALDVLQYVTS